MYRCLSYSDPFGLWPTLAQVTNFAAGFGDLVTGDGTDWARRKLGINGSVNHSSISYSLGNGAGLLTVLAGGTLGLQALGESAAVGEAAEAAEAGEARAVASTPVGSARAPMNVVRGTNVPASINGQQYTGHALDQMQARGLTPSMVEEVLKNGARTAGRDGASIFTTSAGRVIVNPSGSVKTVMFQ